MRPEHRRRISAGQRRHWDQVRRATGVAPPATKTIGRAALAEIMYGPGGVYGPRSIAAIQRTG